MLGPRCSVARAISKELEARRYRLSGVHHIIGLGVAASCFLAASSRCSDVNQRY